MAEIDKLINNFVQRFHQNMETAKHSWALSGGETDVEIGRAVLVITAEVFAPLAPSNKALLKNLRHFV
jgi:hypothetical protein